MESCSGLVIRLVVRSEPKRPIGNRPQINNLPHGNCETALMLPSLEHRDFKMRGLDVVDLYIRGRDEVFD